MSADIHEIGKVSFLDVAGRLRKLADEIDAAKASGTGEYHTVILVLASQAGAISVRSMGHRSTGLEACGWMAKALNLITFSQPSQADEWSTRPPGAA